MQRLFGRRLEAMPTSRLINILGTDDHPVRMVRLALRPIRRVTAHDTNRERLRDILCHSQELGHGLEGLSFVVLIQAGYDDSLSLVGKLLAHIDKVRFEELSLINTDNLSILTECKDLLCVVNDERSERLLAVRDDVLRAVTIVNTGFEDRHLLFRNLRPACPPYQFLGLSAKHASANHLNPPGLPGNTVKL